MNLNTFSSKTINLPTPLSDEINLVLIPDYVSIPVQDLLSSGMYIAGDLKKVPDYCQHNGFVNVEDPANRKALMEMVPQVTRVKIVSPSLAFYKRVNQMEDECFFVDITLRFIIAGTDVEIHSGFMRERIPHIAASWIKTMVETGVKVYYYDPLPSTKEQKRLIIASDILNCYRQGLQELVTAPGTIITPGARDEAKEKGVTILISSGGKA